MISKTIEKIVSSFVFFGSMSQMLLIVFKYMGSISYSWLMVFLPSLIVFGIIFICLAGIGFLALRQTYVEIKKLQIQQQMADVTEKFMKTKMSLDEKTAVGENDEENNR